MNTCNLQLKLKVDFFIPLIRLLSLMEEYIHYPVCLKYSQKTVHIEMPFRTIIITIVQCGSFVYEVKSVLPVEMSLYSGLINSNLEHSTVDVIPSIVRVTFEQRDGNYLRITFLLGGREYHVRFRCNTGGSSFQNYEYVEKTNYISTPVLVVNTL